MDQHVVMDNIINSWIKDNDAWNKFDSEKPQINTVNKCAKHVHDILMKIYPSVNMNNLEFVKERIEKIRKNRKQLFQLKKIPFVEQRSEEWYNIRKNLITASDFGDALGIEKFGKKGDPKKFYQKKCGYDEPPPFDTASVFLKWGVMFEDVACNIYKSRTGIHIHDFGILKNPRHPFLGASPDGINDMGVMLEIKCPYKRKITDDSILKQYYYQIQGQLDACDLSECDFLETKLDTYSDETSFFDDYETQYNVFTNDNMEKGVIVEISDTEYLYSPHNAIKDDVQMWLNENRHRGKVIYWYLDLFSLKRVKKNDNHINTMNIELEDVWNNVLKYRENKTLYEMECKSNNVRTVKSTIKESPTVGSYFRIDPNESLS